MNPAQRLVEIAEHFLNRNKAKKGWSSSEKLIAGQHGSFTMQAQFAETGNYTVQFNLQGLEIPIGQVTPRTAVAEITWSVEGNSVTRRVDIVNGTSVTGTAQAIAVRVIDTSPVQGAGEYVVSVQVAKGSRPSVQQPPYLTEIETVAVALGTSVNVLVPQDVGVISVQVTVFSDLGYQMPSDSYQVAHWRSGFVAKKYSPLDYQGWIPLASGTTYLEFSVDASAHGANFYITWGIDG